jgi:hypothetical protein
VVKLPHEWWIHVARFDGTDFVKTKILGARSETLFWRAIVEAPVVTGAITVAVALLALAIWRLEAFRRRVLALVRRLGHWGRGARDAARESESLGAESPGRLQVVTVRGQAAATLRPRVLLEKIVLVTIVSVVFQQTLPGLLTSGIRTAISIAAVVIATDFLLRWELRRFGVPFSARRELASTGALNFLVVTLLQLFVAALRPGDRPADLPGPGDPGAEGRGDGGRGLRGEPEVRCIGREDRHGAARAPAEGGHRVRGTLPDHGEMSAL